jgi:hypothetical protein
LKVVADAISDCPAAIQPNFSLSKMEQSSVLCLCNRKRSGELATELKKFEEIETRRNGAEIRLKTIAAAKKKKPPTAADGRVNAAGIFRKK